MENKTGRPASRTGRYFKYAIGEIVLVVIGILIALQINNWNEARKQKVEEQVILSNLHTEFQANLIQLKENIEGTDKAIMAGKVILDLMNKTDSTSYTTQEIDSLLRRTIISPYWFPTSLAMNDLVNSGQIAKLTNGDFRKVLYNYNAQLDQIRYQEKLSSKSFDFYLDYIKINGGLRQIDNSSAEAEVPVGPSNFEMNNSTLLEKIEFENALDDYYVYINLRKVNYEKAAKIIQNIVNLSNKEINYELEK